MGRQNWAPTRHSLLCQVHSTPDTWENHRTDGLLKLKRNAIPTLFGNIASNSEDIRQVTPSTIETDSEMVVPAGQPENDDSGVSSEASTTDNEKLFMSQQRELVTKKDLDHSSYLERIDKILQCYAKSEHLRKITKKKLRNANKQTVSKNKYV